MFMIYVDSYVGSEDRTEIIELPVADFDHVEVYPGGEHGPVLVCKYRNGKLTAITLGDDEIYAQAALNAEGGE